MPSRQAESHPDPLLTTEQFAAELQMPAETVATWRWRGKGPKYVRIGKHVRYHRSAIDAWLASLQTGER